MAHEAYDPATDLSAANYPGGNAPWQYNPYTGGEGSGGGSGGGAPAPHTAAAGAPAATGAPAAGGTGFDPGSLQYGANGHVYAYKRTYDPQNNTYGYIPLDLGNPQDPGFSWAGAEASSGIPVGVLQNQYTALLAQTGQTQKSNVMLGNYDVVGFNPDGSLSLRDGRGNVLPPMTEAQASTLQGISPAMIQQAKMEFGTQQRTLAENAYQAAGVTQYGAPNPAAPTGGRGGPAEMAAPGTMDTPASRGTPAGMAAQYASGGAAGALGAGSSVGSPYSLGGLSAQYASGGAAPGGGFASAPTGASPTTAYAMGATGGGTPTATAYASPGDGSGTAPRGGGTPLGTYAGTGVNLTGNGMTNQQYGQQLSGMQNLYNTQKTDYNLRNQTGDNALQDLNRAYETTATTYNLAHQGQQQALSTYREGTQTIGAQNAGQSRNVSGMGFAGIQRPSIAGYQ